MPLAAGCQGHDGLPRWDILSEPTEEVLSGVARIIEGSGRERMLRPASTAQLGANRRLHLFSQARGVTPRTSQERPEGFTAWTGGRTQGPASWGIRHLKPSAEVSPHSGEHPGNRAGRAGLGGGAARRGETGVSGNHLFAMN